ncbi:AzlC family ABC transporter permease [Haladaptatus pallidirubidus]|uniref:AzlC family ABC transporter permease n=1 Tax=Haladaptatus pallidirubidus TaxID=1008152 RepID=A0AAV3UHZ6_9EURY|nr:AzlC family ABC transporter permease [Haladaptatus pallidirubidus]
MSAQKDAFAGARAMVPILLGIIPWALITGVTAVNAGLSPLQAISMSLIVFSGTAQLVMIDLIGQTASVIVIVGTAFIILLRFLMYSASIAPHFRHFSLFWKVICAHVLSDEGYVISLAEFRARNPKECNQKWFYLGSSVTLWATWQIGTIIGVIVGVQIPAGLSLDFVIPLTFTALLFSFLDDQPAILTAIVAGGVGITTSVIPNNLGLVIATFVGVTTGVFVEYRQGVFPTMSDPKAELDSEVDSVDERESL